MFIKRKCTNLFKKSVVLKLGRKQDKTVAKAVTKDEKQAEVTEKQEVIKEEKPKKSKTTKTQEETVVE